MEDLALWLLALVLSGMFLPSLVLDLLWDSEDQLRQPFSWTEQLLDSWLFHLEIAMVDMEEENSPSLADVSHSHYLRYYPFDLCLRKLSFIVC